MDVFGILGMSLGTVGMSLGAIGFIFSVKALNKISRLENQLKETGALDNDYKSE